MSTMAGAQYSNRPFANKRIELTFLVCGSVFSFTGTNVVKCVHNEIPSGNYCNIAW
jgi:hypothetical protein